MAIYRNILCVAGGVFFFFFPSCSSHHTPKPRGYPRIEIEQPRYSPLPVGGLPYSFHISQLMVAGRPSSNYPTHSLTLAYPLFNASIYCSYLPVTPATFSAVEQESRRLVARTAKQVEAVQEMAFQNPQDAVYGTLFLLEDTDASPVQFMLTDSVSHFFRGALYYEIQYNGDSLAPVTRYIREDVVRLMQSFKWNAPCR